MAETTTMTIRVPVELKAKLDRLAGLTRRSRSYLAAEALEIYARNELEIVEGILQGLAEDDAGLTFSHDEVMADLDRLIADADKTRRSA